MKRDNDQLRQGLQFVIDGGSPAQVAKYFQKREEESHLEDHEMDSDQGAGHKKKAENQNDLNANSLLFGDHVDESGYVHYEEGPNGSP